jgi:hypothetical protein
MTRESFSTFLGKTAWASYQASQGSYRGRRGREWRGGRGPGGRGRFTKTQHKRCYYVRTCVTFYLELSANPSHLTQCREYGHMQKDCPRRYVDVSSVANEATEQAPTLADGGSVAADGAQTTAVPSTSACSQAPEQSVAQLN